MQLEFMLPKVTLLYAGLMGLLYMAFSVYVVRMRITHKTGIGHSSDPASPLFRAIRIHGNFNEYVPFILFLMSLDEMTGRNPQIIHTLGFTLLIARIFAFLGIKKSHLKSTERTLGMALTSTCLVFLSVCLIAKGLS